MLTVIVPVVAEVAALPEHPPLANGITPDGVPSTPFATVT
jgi:hypothetical protein